MDKVVPAFMARFEVDPNTGCWLWWGANSGPGQAYGRVTVGGRTKPAHRVMYELFEGEIAPGLMLCHHCDTPPCVNPAHLFPGTGHDNMADCARKGRDRNKRKRGETNNQAVLTEAQVLAIFMDTRTQGRIALEYGVHRTTINLIQAGKKWGWLTAHLPHLKRAMGAPKRPSKTAA